MSRETDTILGQGTIPEPSTPHIGKEVALVALAALSCTYTLEFLR